MLNKVVPFYGVGGGWTGRLVGESGVQAAVGGIAIQRKHSACEEYREYM